MKETVKNGGVLKVILYVSVIVVLFGVVLQTTGNTAYAADRPVINKSSLAMYVGEKDKLQVAGSGEYTFDSLNSQVVEVDSEGNVTAVGVGDTHILVEGKISFVVYVVVKKAELSETNTTVYINGETKKLEVYGSNGQTVIWKSKNNAVARVSRDGTVTGISIGVATVVANMNGEEFLCTVYVKNPYLSEKEITVSTGGTYKINLIGSNGEVAYKVANEAIAKVDAIGVITGVREGKTKITLTYGSITYRLTVNVLHFRLSTNTTKCWINQESVINIQLKDRQKGESITITDTNDVVGIHIGPWKGDIVKVTLTPKKDGVTKLKVARNNGTESIEITVHAKVRRLLTAEEIYKVYAEATVAITSYDAVGNPKVGSGFFIDSGILVTNYHVIEYANKLEVIDYKGKTYNVTSIYDYNTKSNLAVLEVTPDNEGVFYRNNANVHTGEDIYTIGSPLEYIGTISEGIISFATRNMDGIKYIQVTAPISKSSGGGPLINQYGEVIGVNTLTVPTAQNINFAVKIGYLSGLDMNNKRSIEKFYEENKDKVIDMTIEIVIG